MGFLTRALEAEDKWLRAAAVTGVRAFIGEEAMVIDEVAVTPVAVLAAATAAEADTFVGEEVSAVAVAVIILRTAFERGRDDADVEEETDEFEDVAEAEVVLGAAVVVVKGIVFDCGEKSPDAL
jgi:hypothetical protein